MSLISSNIFNTTKTQYFFKLKTNFGLFFSLILVQMFAIFFSLGGVGSSVMGTSEVNINIAYFSGNIVMVFTLIWAFTISVTMATKNNRNMDFTFVSNRLTSNYSSIGFLITLGLYGSLTSSLASNLVRVLVYLTSEGKSIVSDGFIIAPQYMLMTIIGMLFYIILISSIGYFLGSLAQLNKAFILLLSAILPFGIIFGLRLYSSSIKSTSMNFINKVVNSYILESSLGIFTLKVLITATVFFLGAVLISNRVEVRK